MIKISNPIRQFTDEFVEEVVRGIPRTAKKQIFGTKPDDKISKTTGKPIPSKKVLTQLTQAANQLRLAKLQKTREDLARMRLKTDEKKPLTEIQKNKKIDNIVEQTLKNAGSTGEFKAGAG